MTSSTTANKPAETASNLRRDVGLIGLLFASVGSIIGSGWLFGAMNASTPAGPAAIFSWAIGMVMILLIALIFAELGTVFPVSGGVVRFPHIAFGSSPATSPAGSSGSPAPPWRRSRSRARCSTPPSTPTSPPSTSVDGETVHTLTALGLRRRGGPDGAVRGHQLLRGPLVRARSTTCSSGGSSRSSSLVVIAFLRDRSSTARNFTLARVRARRRRRHLHRHRHRPASSSPTWASVRASSSPARRPTRKRNVPIAVIGSVLIDRADLHRCCRSPSSAPLNPQDFSRRLGQPQLHQRLRPAGGDRQRPRSRLARGPALRRRDHLARPTPA